MSNTAVTKLIAAYLNKRAAEEQLPTSPAEAMHEAAETPDKEKLEHLAGGEEAGGEQMPGAAAAGEHGGEDIDHLLSQLSPEELEHLASSLAEDMHQGAGHPGEEQSHGDTHELAQAIQEHLAQNPEAGLEGVEPEKMAALTFVKSAAYIEGFLEQALDRGASVKQAVDMYDNALAKTLATLKQAELKGNQHKLDVNHNGKIDAEDLKKLRSGTPKVDKHDDVKTAAYYEGVIERAREYGFSDSEAVQIVKAAMDKTAEDAKVSLFKQLASEATPYLSKAKRSLVKNRGKVGVGVGVAGTAANSMLSDDK